MWLWPVTRRQFALWPRNLHAGDVFGLEFYRRAMRCSRMVVPEVLFALGGLALTFRAVAFA
jgi:hypothetical protein